MQKGQEASTIDELKFHVLFFTSQTQTFQKSCFPQCANRTASEKTANTSDINANLVLTRCVAVNPRAEQLICKIKGHLKTHNKPTGNLH